MKKGQEKRKNKELIVFSLSRRCEKLLNNEMSNNDSQVPRIMVFRPTWEQFRNFSSYIEYMESKGAHLAGVVKVCCNAHFFHNIYFVHERFV